MVFYAIQKDMRQKSLLTKKMTVCVIKRKSINLYKLTANEHNIKKKTDFLFFCSQAFLT